MNQPTRSVTSKKVFCEHCVSETTDETPGDVRSLNGVGRKFYGSAAPCPQCASVIRTLWWTFASIPLLPVASYRYKTASEHYLGANVRSRFWCRQLPSCDWGQVLKTWALGFALTAAFIVAIYYWQTTEK